MPAESSTIFVPFRLRNPGGGFQLDTVVGNYDIEVYKAGVLFAPVGGFTITTPGSQFGRHILSFLGGTKDDYLFFVDYTAGNFDVSIDSGLVVSDKFLSSGIPAAVDALLSASHGAGTWDDSTMLTRQVLIEKILRNRLETDPVTGVMTLYDDDNVTPLISGTIFEDIAQAQAYRGQGIDRRNRLT